MPCKRSALIGWSQSTDRGNLPSRERHVACEAFERFDIGICDQVVSLTVGSMDVGSWSTTYG